MAWSEIGSDLAAAGRWRPPPRAVYGLKLALVLALWPSGLVLLAHPSAMLAEARDVAFLVLLALALPAAKPISRAVALVGLVAASVLWLAYDRPRALIDAADAALVFILFLPALLLLRETMQVSPEARAAEDAFDALGPGRRIAGLTIGSHLLASVMIIGALPIIRPFIVRQDDPALRLELARAAMRGFALCVLWSPLTVAMVFVSTQKPAVSLVEVMALGLPTTVLALVGAVWLDRGWPGVRAALPALAAFRSLAVPVAVVIGIVVALASTTSLSTLEVVALTLPPLCLLRLAILPDRPFARVLPRTIADLPRMGDELLIFTGAVLLGDLITASGAADGVARALHLAAWPPALVPLLGFALGPPLALLGLHPIVSGTILLALLAPVDGLLPDLLEIQIVLFAWMAGAMISYASLSVVAAARLFDIPTRELALSLNLRFLAGLGLLLALGQGLWLAGG